MEKGGGGGGQRKPAARNRRPRPRVAVLSGQPAAGDDLPARGTKMRSGRLLVTTMLLAAMLGVSACTKHMGVGAGVGAATGAGLGALSGGSILGGAATGAAVGAGGGYAYDKLHH